MLLPLRRSHWRPKRANATMKAPMARNINLLLGSIRVPNQSFRIPHTWGVMYRWMCSSQDRPIIKKHQVDASRPIECLRRCSHREAFYINAGDQLYSNWLARTVAIMGDWLWCCCVVTNPRGMMMVGGHSSKIGIVWSLKTSANNTVSIIGSTTGSSSFGSSRTLRLWRT